MEVYASKDQAAESGRPETERINMHWGSFVLGFVIGPVVVAMFMGSLALRQILKDGWNK